MSETVVLPPLPEPDGSAPVVIGQERVGRFVADIETEVDAWSQPLVEAFARTAVLAERERILARLKDWDFDITNEASAETFAAAIRSGK